MKHGGSLLRYILVLFGTFLTMGLVCVGAVGLVSWGLPAWTLVGVWLFQCLLLGVVLSVVSHGLTGLAAAGVITDYRNKYSLSRCQFLLWLLTILSALLTAMLANVGSGATRPLDIEVPLSLVGLSVGTLLAEPVIFKSLRVRKDAGELKTMADATRNILSKSGYFSQKGLLVRQDRVQGRFRDLIMGDRVDNITKLEFSKIQFVSVTLLAWGTYVVALCKLFAGFDGRIVELPGLEPGVLILFAAVHVAYLANGFFLPRNSYPRELSGFANEQ